MSYVDNDETRVKAHKPTRAWASSSAYRKLVTQFAGDVIACDAGARSFREVCRAKEGHRTARDDAKAALAEVASDVLVAGQTRME